MEDNAYEGLYDCIVVGAGPAGLSASLFLARYLHPVLTFHHNSPRNEYAHGIHGFLGHHGIAPTELLARGRAEVTDQGGRIIEARVTGVRKISDDHFRVTAGAKAEPKEFETRRVLLATGLRDLTPDCPGFREFYGVSVHHCPDCDGYEYRKKRITVLGGGRKTVGFALSLLTWTQKITLITGGDEEDISPEDYERLKSFDIRVHHQNVAALEGDSDSQQLKRVLLSDNNSIECDALFFNLGTEPASDLHEMLGCRLDRESGLVWVDHAQETSVAGVYAAGDLTPNSQLAIVAAAEGAMAAIHIHQSLIPPERKL